MRRQLRSMMAVGWLVGACASERAATSGADPGGAGETATTDTRAAMEARDRLEPLLLDCARLTYAGSETPIEIRAFVDGRGSTVALEVTDLERRPLSMMCPGDRPGTDAVVRGGGKGWGRRPASGWMVEAFCAPGFDGTTGCSARSSYVLPAAAPEPPSTAKAPVATNGEGSAAGATVRRADAFRRYQLRRLGTDVDGDKQVNLEQQLVVLDQALLLCLHSRLPDINLSSSADVSARIGVNLDSKALSAPLKVRSMNPPALWTFLAPCLKAVTGDDETRGIEATVRYTLVAEATETPPGKFVQQVSLEMLQEQVEVTAPAPARKQAADRLLAAMQTCLQEHPVESRGALGRWATLGAVRFQGTVASPVASALQLLELKALAADSDKDPPDALSGAARCTLAALAPSNPSGTPARVSWTVVVKVGPLE
ncbi:MAG: hypothetical protein HY904_07630 [Deltaproteobacteria bacterium]|nr:hypothetical protein [Deltaproteobacteria bacterium]